MMPRLLIRAVVLVVLVGLCPGGGTARTRETEEQLLARLQTENNPVRKAKVEIRLGRLKLERAVEAYGQGNVEGGATLLDAYLGRVTEAWQTLRGSGRNAARHPEGFKELDIALREDIRRLEDVKHRIAFDDRGPAEKVSKEIEGIRSEVLRALFPAGRPPATGAPIPATGAPAPPPGPSGLLRTLPPNEGYGLLPTPAPQAQPKDILSDEEDDKIREAQDPSDRIEVYIQFAQARLERVDDYRQRPADPTYDVGAFLAKMTGQYVNLIDEMKNWIQDKFDAQLDMRRGLQKLLEAGPQQLQRLRNIQESPGPYASDYRQSLGDAIDDLTDALDGATKALADQVKMFGQLKQEVKADDRSAKEREKEAKKRAKEEKKFRKKERKHGAPTDVDEE